MESETSYIQYRLFCFPEDQLLRDHSKPFLVSLTSKPMAARRSRMRSLVVQSLRALASERISRRRSTACSKGFIEAAPSAVSTAAESTFIPRMSTRNVLKIRRRASMSFCEALSEPSFMRFTMEQASKRCARRTGVLKSSSSAS